MVTLDALIASHTQNCKLFFFFCSHLRQTWLAAFFSYQVSLLWKIYYYVTWVTVEMGDDRECAIHTQVQFSAKKVTFSSCCNYLPLLRRCLSVHKRSKKLGDIWPAQVAPAVITLHGGEHKLSLTLLKSAWLLTPRPAREVFVVFSRVKWS